MRTVRKKASMIATALALITAGLNVGTLPAQGDETTFSGVATFYEATGFGNCSFDASPENLLVAALNDPQYDNAALCGSHVLVTGPKGTVTVRIVDRCPECAAGNLDLSQEAFAHIGEPIEGIIPITWKVVSPAAESPISFKFKEGSSEYWTAVQVRNHRNPITKFEYKNDDGQWVEVERLDYNFFVKFEGMGPGPYDFRITDTNGNQITETDVSFAEGQVVEGTGQFPATNP